MTNQNELLDIFEKRQKQQEQVLASVQQIIETSFPESSQNEIIFDMYAQLFKVSNELQELNHAHIFLSSYFESFHHHLVGEGKLITEEEFRGVAQQAYEGAIEQVEKVMETAGE